MSNFIPKHEKINERLTLSEMKDGFWLYDYLIGYNIVVRAKTRDEALFQGLMYYQKRTSDMRKELRSMRECFEEFGERMSEIADPYRDK